MTALRSTRFAGRRLDAAPLAPGTADVWCIAPDEVTDVDACRTLLSADEIARYERFRVPAPRQQYLVAHAFLRTLLSLYTDVDPRAWAFADNDHGKPEIASPALPLRFNLSHTAGLVAVAVAVDRAIGVDAEDTRRKRALLQLADRYFAASEASAVRAVRGAAQRRRFFEYWTLKEAYVKACGLGLSLPLARFAFQLDAEPAIAITIAPELGEDAADWQFRLFRPTARHVVAVALRRGPEAEWTIALRLPARR